MFFSFSLVSQCPVFPLLFQFLLSKNPASAWSWGHYRKKEQVEPNIVEPFSWVQRSKSAKWSSRTGNTSQTRFNGVIPLLSLSIRTQFLFCFAFFFFLFPKGFKQSSHPLRAPHIATHLISTNHQLLWWHKLLDVTGRSHSAAETLHGLRARASPGRAWASAAWDKLNVE